MFFFYTSFPSLHDYDVEMSNATLYGGRKLACVADALNLL